MAKKILVIKKVKFKDEYLLNIIEREHWGQMRKGVETTANRDDAMDITDLDFSIFAMLCKGLRNAGYKTKVIVIEDEDNGEDS